MTRPLLLLLLLAGCGQVRDLFSNREDKSEKKAEKKADKERGSGDGFTREHAPEGLATRALGPDILFITWDTIRADHMGLYGYPRDTTPVIDTFAEQAVVFDRFIVPMSTTLPSHTSMFTGVRPEEHGILANATFTGERFIPSEQLVPLAGWLAGQGYMTAGFVSSTPLKRYSGIAAGFHMWSEPGGDHRRGGDTVDLALGWLKEAPPEAPLFMWVHLYDPHYPYRPVPDLERHFTEDEPLRVLLAERDMVRKGTGPKIAERVNDYDADIFYTDRETGRLLAAWQRSDRWDRTIVVFAGDHGEGLGQHNHVEHGLVWYEQLHAPLLIRAPGQAPRRVPHAVSAHDILPTLLGLVELPAEETMRAQVTGHDLLAPDFSPQPVFSRSSVRQVRLGTHASFAITTDRWKLEIQGEDKTALYDLQADPHELTNVAKDHRDVVQELTELGRQWFHEQRALAQKLGAGKTEKLDAGTLGELQQLGYLD